jgi:hypothetical protein
MKIIATNFMPEVVLGLSYDRKKMLESCPLELKNGLPIPVIMGILVRVKFIRAGLIPVLMGLLITPIPRELHSPWALCTIHVRLRGRLKHGSAEGH